MWTRRALRTVFALGNLLEHHTPYPSAPKVPPGMRANGPDFVGIGAQKAGTTWVANLVRMHPKFYFHMPLALRLRPSALGPITPKERHFFDHLYATFDDACIEQYQRWFPRPEDKVTGEFTPTYMDDFWVAAQLARAAPVAKIVCLVRDPIERFVSGLAESGATTRTTMRAHHSRSLYHGHLERWARYFSREQLLVIQYEKLRREPERGIRELYRFLGLGDDFMPAEERWQRNANPTKGPRAKLTESVVEQLKIEYRSDIERLVRDHPHIDLSLWPNFREMA